MPCAHGGTSLDQWSYTLKDQGGHSLYGAMLVRAERCGAPIRGLLWYQGESDAFGEHADTYGERLAEWIAAARADLGQPDLPVIVVQLGCLVATGWGTEKDWDLVREALADLPDQVPHTAVVAAVDLGLEDLIHIHSRGLVRLGRRMARQALRLTDRTDLPAGPRPERLELRTAPNGLPAVYLHCSGMTGAWTAENLFGFSVHTADGQPHPELMIANASPDPEDPAVLRILLTPVEASLEGAHLAYGAGFAPCCNAVDESDMGLCSFLPKPIGWERG
jgi:hypothetical protein